MEVVQAGLAPFQGASTRAETAPPLTTVSRKTRRDYTLTVATSFTATSQPFEVFQANIYENYPWHAVNDAATTPQTKLVDIPVIVNDDAGYSTQTIFFPNGTNQTSFTSNAILQFTSTQPSHGVVVVDLATRIATYTPNRLFYGPDLFTYTLVDAYGNTTATVNVTVTAVPPVSRHCCARQRQGRPWGSVDFEHPHATG